MKQLIQRFTQITVLPEGEPISSEMATRITIEEEGGGEYVKVAQYAYRPENGEININPDEWSEIRDAIDIMIAACRKEDA